MRTPIHEPLVRLLVASVALVALASCAPRKEVREIDPGQGGATVSTSGSVAEHPASGARLMLRDGWQIQTSTGQPEGDAVSKSGFAASGWFTTTIPATVSGVLAQKGVYPDPFVGANLRSWPGMGTPDSRRSSVRRDG